MTSLRSRLLAASLAAVLALGAPLTALADELPAAPGGDSGSSADLLDITVPNYTPQMAGSQNIQKGERYTLIVLPSADAATGSTPKELTAQLLTTAEPLFIGSAVADVDGHVTFTDIHLRTAEAAVYYVTGPGLDKPLAEATNASVAAGGRVYRTENGVQKGVANASVSLVDKTTGYAYANSVRSSDNGNYYLDRLAPGEYFLHVEKPGYLPATAKSASNISDRETHLGLNFDLSAFLGDVNGDAARDISDLTALLSCCGAATLPDGLTPDLNEDGAVDQADAALLLGVMTSEDGFPAGAGDGSSASLSIRDVTAQNAADRTLLLSLNNGGDSALTFTAASVSLTFRADYIQPVNQSGGAVSPGSVNSSANCLIPRAGVTVDHTSWELNGDLATLTFSLSCARPTALADLVEFRYRPAPGKTVNDFFQGVFDLDHVAALVGADTVLTSCGLTYPSSAPLELDSISIVQEDTTLTIPSVGRSLALALSVNGVKGDATYPNLPGVTWTVSDETGGGVSGVSVSDSLLTVSHQATPGTVIVTAAVGSHTDSMTLTLENAPSVPSAVTVLKGDSPIVSDALSGPAGTPLAVSYAAQVLDQYDSVMDDQTVSWSLSGAPNGVSLSEGELTVADTLPAGTYSFSVHAALNSLQSTVAVTLRLEPELHSLVLSGPTAAQIPSKGSPSLTLPYQFSALDAQGNAMSTEGLNLSFSVQAVDGEEGSPAPEGIIPEAVMGRSLTVTVTDAAHYGDYILRVSEGDVSAELTLILQDASETRAPTRAALSYQGAVVESLSLSVVQGGGKPPFALIPRILDQNGEPIVFHSQAWSWNFPGHPEPVTWVTDTDGNVELDVDTDGMAPGSYFFTCTATESSSGLSFTVPVTLTVIPKVTLSLSAPSELTIPSSGSLSYTIGVTATDANGDPTLLPDDLVWEVTGAEVDPGDTVVTITPPAGVTLNQNTLTISSFAKPGVITVFVSRGDDAPVDAGQTEFIQIELKAASQEKVLVLRRDGELLSGGVDTTYGKEGSAITLSYTPVLRDPTTGEVTELTKDVTWVGVQGAFTVDSKTEPGVYTAPVTALYGGQSVSLTAQITVYPDITGLYISFDEGDADSKAESYSFPVSPRLSKTYRGDLMAKINRGGKSLTVPLVQLDLTDYDIDLYTYLTGVYLSFDKATGRVALTIDSVAASNSMAAPDPGALDIRSLGIDFSYYPGQEPLELFQPLRLTKEGSTVTTAVLRQGSGAGSKFVFETTRGQTALTTASGVLSDCFALELLDQYGDPVLNQYVNWSLTGSPTDSKGNALITCVAPAAAITAAYPRYQSIRRIRVSPDTPEGTYTLTLTAGSGSTENEAVNSPAFLRSVDIVLTVSGRQEVSSVTLSGPASVMIPIWYVRYNSSALNNATNTVSFVAVAQNAYGNELDFSLCDFAWSVTDADGGKPAGVSISADGKDPATATLTVDRNALPTGSKEEDLLRVSVTATPKGSDVSFTSSAGLALTRGSLVPTLMTIHGPSSFNLELDDPTVTQEYTFDLVNQYNGPVSELEAQSVTWSLNDRHPSHISLSTTQKNGRPVATLRITNPNRDLRSTVTLTASIVFPESSTSSGEATVYQSLPITVVVGNPSSGGGGGIIGGGGLPADTVTTPGLTVSPSVNKSGTTGTVTLSNAEINDVTKNASIGTLTIAPKNTSGLTSITVNIPSSVTHVAAEGQAGVYSARLQTLRIQTDIGTVTIPQRALLDFSSTGASSVTILNQDNKLAVTFTTASGREITSFSSPVTFTAPVKGDTLASYKGGVSLSSNAWQTAIVNGTLTLSLTGSAEITVSTKPQGKVFSDTTNHWAKSAVNFVVERGLFQGTSETTFSPNGQMTRSMVVTVLHRLENTPASSAANLFSDVPSDTWYTDAVVWANASGIVQGTGDGFLPNGPVTREQLAVILYRYMGSIGKATDQRASLSTFSDAASVSSWARDAMEWAVSSGLINGKTGGLLDPGGNATRAEVATMFERLVLKIASAA